MKHRGIAKTMRYLIMDTEGAQEFKAQVFIDDKYRSMSYGEAFTDDTLFSDGTGFFPESVIPLTPALEADFIAKDAGGWGLQGYGNSPYGGGNNTRLRLLTEMPTKFNTFKLRFTASTKGLLKYTAITLLYQQGTIRRMP
jgi:hypothetical protein